MISPAQPPERCGVCATPPCGMLSFGHVVASVRSLRALAIAGYTV